MYKEFFNQHMSHNTPSTASYGFYVEREIVYMPTGVYKRTKPVWNKGIPHSEKHKENLRKAWDQAKHIPTQKAIESWKIGVGRLHTPEIAKKISLALKGKPGHKQTQETREKIKKAVIEKINNGTHNFFHMTKEQRILGVKNKSGILKISDKERKRRSIFFSKENNPNWKGGITPLNMEIRYSKKTKIWRELVFKRDDWTCQECKIRGGKLEAHHIKMFCDIIKENKIETLIMALNCNELWDINNGQTLCRGCHEKTKIFKGNQYAKL